MTTVAVTAFTALSGSIAGVREAIVGFLEVLAGLVILHVIAFPLLVVAARRGLTRTQGQGPDNKALNLTGASRP
jgi:hypothetical protein